MITERYRETETRLPLWEIVGIVIGNLLMQKERNINRVVLGLIIKTASSMRILNLLFLGVSSFQRFWRHLYDGGLLLHACILITI